MTNHSPQDAINCLNTTTRADIPGYLTDSPSESQLDNYSALESAISQRALRSESAQLVHQLAQQRPYFILDVHKDPITPGYELKTCEESKGQQIYTCTKTLIEPSITITPAKYSNYWCRVGRHRPDDPACQAKTYYDPAIMYEPEKIDITQEVYKVTVNQLFAQSLGIVGNTAMSISAHIQLKMIVNACVNHLVSKLILSV